VGKLRAAHRERAALAAERLATAPSDSESLLDAAVEYTFPASDPIAVETAFKAARRREERSSAPAIRRQRRSVL
jgi:hypothetical protein